MQTNQPTDLVLKKNEDGYEEVLYKGSHIASITPIDPDDPSGGHTVEYGSHFALDRGFTTKSAALHWLTDNAGDLADPDVRDQI